jgi:hypothetical protein
VLMPNDTVVVPQCSNSPNAEMYCVRLDQWIPDSAVKASIVEAASIETGPGLLLTDGRTFFVGATGATALYTAGPDDVTAGTWAQGPQFPLASARPPQNQGAKDGPAALLPSGTVLLAVAPVDNIKANYNSPSSFFEFDGVNHNRASDPPNANCPTYVGRLLVLPTGQILWTREDDNNFYIYTETSAPLAAAKPVINTAPTVLRPGSTVTVSGTQFNGLSRAVSYGDDYGAATNYPLVRITNLTSGAVRYCRTANHSTTVSGVTRPAMGGTIVDTQVTLPGDLALGEAQLVVVANGIPSDPVKVVVRPVVVSVNWWKSN